MTVYAPFSKEEESRFREAAEPSARFYASEARLDAIAQWEERARWLATLTDLTRERDALTKEVGTLTSRLADCDRAGYEMSADHLSERDALRAALQTLLGLVDAYGFGGAMPATVFEQAQDAKDKARAALSTARAKTAEDSEILALRNNEALRAEVERLRAENKKMRTLAIGKIVSRAEHWRKAGVLSDEAWGGVCAAIFVSTPEETQAWLDRLPEIERRRILEDIPRFLASEENQARPSRGGGQGAPRGGEEGA